VLPLNLRSKIEERQLNIYHVFIATMLGELAVRGFINQGVVRMVISSIGEKILEYLKIKNPRLFNISADQEGIREVIEETIKALDSFEQYKVEICDQFITIAINAPACKFCPRGVGGIELPGTLCIFPGLFTAVLTKALNKTFYSVTPLIKKEEWCIFKIKQG